MSRSTRQRPMWGLVLVTSLVLGVLAARAVPPSASAAEEPHTLAFGAFTQPQGSQTLQQAVQQLEGQIGRQLGVVRVFETWSNAFPSSYHQWLKSTGRPMILSVKPIRSNGTRVAWTAIAAAQPGSQIDDEIRSWARRIRDYAVPIWVTFNHEPESTNSTNGTGAEFVQAWRKWVDIFREEGATNVRHMWIMTDYAFHVNQSDRRHAPKWYPGDAWVDGMAIDAYNWHVCRPNQDNPWKTLATIIEPFRQFGLQHPDEELWLTEWATWEDPTVTNRKAQWMDQARALFSQPAYSQFEGVVYFHSRAINQSFVNCDWRVTTTASSLQSFRAMGLDPLYGGSPFPSPTTTTTTSTSTSTSSSTLPDTSTTVDDSTTTTVDDSTTTTDTSTSTTSTTSTSTTSTTTTSTTTTTTQPTAPISVVGQASSSANVTAHRVVIPAGVQPGDALILAFSANTDATVSAPAGVTGWTSLGVRSNSSMSSRMWSRVAVAGDAGRTITVNVSRISKGTLVVVAYRGTSTSTPVATAASALETVSRASHTTPAVDVPTSGAWVVSYWAHKDATSTALVPPAGVVVRASNSQTGSGRMTTLFADSGGPVGAGATPGRTATGASATTYAAMFTVVLAPG